MSTLGLVVGCSGGDGQAPASVAEPALQAPRADDCGSWPYSDTSLYAERVGFGGATTGGDRDRLYRVTSRADSGAGTLRDALESDTAWWVVFEVEGRFELDDPIDVRSNKTVDGRGRDVRIVGNLRIREGVHNVIVSDVDLSNPVDGQDTVTVYGDTTEDPDRLTTRKLWFHHLDLHDGGDGLLDFTHAVTDVTVSWCHFHDQVKAVLIASDGDHPEVDSAMRLTFHHNHFEGVTRRGPRLRFGWVDYFNNYQQHWYEYGVGVFSDAQLISQANIYEARPGLVCVAPCPDPNSPDDSDALVSKKGLTVHWADLPPGKVLSVGDLTLNGARVANNRGFDVFTREDFYDAQVEPATRALADDIAALSGPRLDGCGP